MLSKERERKYSVEAIRGTQGRGKMPHWALLWLDGVLVLGYTGNETDTGQGLRSI